MLGDIPYLFDYCTNPDVHLLLLKSSMTQESKKISTCANCDELRVGTSVTRFGKIIPLRKNLKNIGCT